MDVAGSLQFGLTPTVEFGKKVSGYLRLRLMNTGLLSYFLLGRDRDDDFRWGLGVGTGLHIFSAKDGNMRGLFGGPGFEYLYVKTRGDYADYGTHALLPQFDMGYRWAWNSFMLGLGARFGLYVPVHTRVMPDGIFGCRFSNVCSTDDFDNLKFIAGVFVDLGWFL